MTTILYTINTVHYIHNIIYDYMILLQLYTIQLYNLMLYNYTVVTMLYSI